jgi:hypothetical protein
MNRLGGALALVGVVALLFATATAAQASPNTGQPVTLSGAPLHPVLVPSVPSGANSWALNLSASGTSTPATGALPDSLSCNQYVSDPEQYLGYGPGSRIVGEISESCSHVTGMYVSVCVQHAHPGKSDWATDICDAESSSATATISATADHYCPGNNLWQYRISGVAFVLYNGVWQQEGPHYEGDLLTLC